MTAHAPGITLLHSGTIRTMTGPDELAEAIALDGERILAVGDLPHVREAARQRAHAQQAAGAAGEIREIDLRGAVVLPGFIDPHGHLIQAGTAAAQVDLTDATSIPEIIERLREGLRTRDGDPAAPLVGVGYDQTLLSQQRHPVRSDLDQVGTDVPIVALHRSVHLAGVSTTTLAACGITADTPDPEGAAFGREADGTPSGYVEEMAALAMIAAGLATEEAPAGLIPGARTTRREAIAAAQREYLAQGITTAQEGAANQADIRALAQADRAGELILNVVAYPLVTDGRTDALGDLERARSLLEHGDESARGDRAADSAPRARRRVRIGGAKLILDGAPLGRSAWMSEPYAPETDDAPAQPGRCDCGYPALDDQDVDSVVAQVVGAGWQILAHCNGDAAAEQFLRALEAARREDAHSKNARGSDAALSAPPVMIHAQTVRDDQLDRMAALDMTASFFIGHVHHWGDVHLKNLGPDRGRRISPARSALDRGVAITLHQDAPVTPPDMRVSLAAAVGRTSRLGTPIGPEQAITPYEALAAVTCGAARQYGMDANIGRLAPGMRADLVVCDRDPGAPGTTAAQIGELRIWATLKDGCVVHGAIPPSCDRPTSESPIDHPRTPHQEMP